MSPSTLAPRIFGDGLELLRVPGARCVGPVLTEWSSSSSLEVLADIDVLVTGWGLPPLPSQTVLGASRLRAVLHSGGGVHGLLPEPLPRPLEVSTAADINAVPVAEYAFAMILLAGKSTFAAQTLYRHRRAYIDREREFARSGNFGRTVGVVGASRIGRRVLALLRQTDLRVLLYDPSLDAGQARALGAELRTLDDLVAHSDVLTLHAPVLTETIGMISRRRLATMPDGAVLINTARGAIVDQEALLAELRTGRISAVLDVTTPDPLPATSELFDLPNVLVTPHIAGSMGNELRRLGEHVAGELGRLVAGEPLATPEPLVATAVA